MVKLSCLLKKVNVKGPRGQYAYVDPDVEAGTKSNDKDLKLFIILTQKQTQEGLASSLSGTVVNRVVWHKRRSRRPGKCPVTGQYRESNLMNPMVQRNWWQEGRQVRDG